MRLSRLRWMIVSLIACVLLTLAGAVFLRHRRPTDTNEYAAILADWDQAGIVKDQIKSSSDKRAQQQHLADRCLSLAAKYPNTAVELAALHLAAGRAADTAPGTKAGEILLARIKTTDLEQLALAITGLGLRPGPRLPKIAYPIINRVKQSPDHPRAAELLAEVCMMLGWDSDTKDPPRHFSEAADLIAQRFADSPDIEHFCETLGNGLSRSPYWAGQFERHLTTVLNVNKDRWVRCTASLGLISIAQSSVERQLEAEALYEKFLAEFDGQTKYLEQQVEREYYRRAKLQLEAMRFTPIGKQAPEIVGVDLGGQSMTLSDYRGKVVLLSFWATWCYPCVKLIPHERELAMRLKDEPFAVVGVNSDDDSEAIMQAVARHRIIWRSFQDKRPGMKSISNEWIATFPTMYLIDHKGVIRNRFTGSPPIEELNQMVDELVKAAHLELPVRP